MTTREYLPALRGRLGDWAFYSILMTLEQVAAKVDYAREIHKSEKLSELIQRELDDKTRAGEIGNYLLKNEDRFFNSLVVALYGGDPEWHEFQHFKQVASDLDEGQISYNSRYSIGFLSMSGEEKLFALDGQHRLAGIRNALKEKVALGEEEVSVIVVAHHKDVDGLRRTRKLFTTLNKTAKPVLKSEIIALDEADAMAITARELVEHDKRFNEKRIDILRKTANLPSTDTSHLTTLINLYDVLEILFSRIDNIGTASKDLKRVRPGDEELKRYYKLADEYFTLLAKAFPKLGECLRSTKPDVSIKKHRRASGGDVLFRPVGLLVFTEVIAALVRNGKTLSDAIEEIKVLPLQLSRYPYDGILWDNASKTMKTGGRALVRDLLLYYLGQIKDAPRVKKLQQRYAARLGGDATQFPIRQKTSV